MKGDAAETGLQTGMGKSRDENSKSRVSCHRTRSVRWPSLRSRSQSRLAGYASISYVSHALDRWRFVLPFMWFFGLVVNIMKEFRPDVRRIGYVAAILDGSNLSDFRHGKFSDPVVEGL